MELFSGHVGVFINGDATWAFIALAVIAAVLGKFGLSEDEREAPTAQVFDETSGALTYSVMMSMSLVLLLFGAFVDHTMDWGVAVVLLATAVCARPLYLRAVSRLLNARHPKVDDEILPV